MPLIRLELLLPTLAALLAAALNPPAPPPGPLPASSPPRVARNWPVGTVGTHPPVLRAWDPPSTAYGAGHRGVDLAAPPGTSVRAVAPGRVSFAGRVAGEGVVSVELDGTGDPPLRTTYEPVRPTVKKGAEVTAGKEVGVLESPTGHCAGGCLHWGLLRGETYLDPLSLLPPWLLRRGPSRLLPLTDAPPGMRAGMTWDGWLPGRGLSPARLAGPWPRPPR